MPLSQLTGTGDTDAVTKINAAIVEADRVDGLATRMTSAEASIVSEQTTREARDVEERNNRIAAVNNEAQLRQAGDVNEALAREARDQLFAAQSVARDTALGGQIAAEADARAAGDAKLLADVTASPARPGEGRLFTGADLLLPPSQVTPLPDADRLMVDGMGWVARVAGDGQVAPLRPVRIEPGHDYQVRFAFALASNPRPPGVQAVRLALRSLDGQERLLGTTILADLTDITVATGRLEYVFRFSLYGGEADDVAIRRDTVSVWPYLAPIGGGTIYAEVIEVADVSIGVDYAPDLTGIRSEVNRLAGAVAQAEIVAEAATMALANSADAANLTTGTLDDERLSENVVLRTGDQTISGTKTFDAPVFIGSPGRELRAMEEDGVISLSPPDGNGSWQDDNAIRIAPFADNRWTVEDFEVRGRIYFPLPALTRAELQVYSTGETDAAIAAAFDTLNALLYKGAIDCSTNPNYPAASAGFVYLVSVAGKIGGASGISVEPGDMLVCKTDGTAAGTQAAVGAQWNVIQYNVVSPLKQADIGVLVQAYDDDLAALAGLASTGIVARTGAGTVAARTLTGTSGEIAVTNGDGVAGNPTISLPSTIALAGKTVTGLAASSIVNTPAGTIAATTVQAALNELDAEKLALTGGTLTGNLTLSSASPLVTFNKSASGQVCRVISSTNNLTRWALDIGSTTSESGGNAGSDVVLYRYSDAGGFIDTALTIVRSTGETRVKSLADIAGNILIDANRHLRLRSYTLGTLPPANAAAGQEIFCSDLGGGGRSLESDGTNWVRVGRGGHQTISSDAAVTLTTLTSAEEQRHTGTLTADRTITLSTTNAYAGARFRVTRTGSGAFNLSIGGLKNLATNTWAEVIYDGTVWYLAETGAL